MVNIYNDNKREISREGKSMLRRMNTALKREEDMTLSLIFDMDGTLFQTDRILEISLEDTFNYLRSTNNWDAATPIDLYRKIMGVPLPKVWETLLPEHSISVREKVDSYFLKRLIDNIKSGRGALYPNVQKTFNVLKENGWTIYIASNGLVEYLNTIIEHYGLEEWITETFSIEQIDSLNKSELVKTILEKHDISTAIVIGDRLSDFKAAEDNDLPSIGCDFDFARQEELIHADRIINDLMELTSIIPELMKQHV
jgi:adenosylhomocysteine nucleosidase